MASALLLGGFRAMDARSTLFLRPSARLLFKLEQSANVSPLSGAGMRFGRGGYA